MALAIAPLAAARPSYQLQSAQREARQAEQTAQNLRRQADEAQRSADQEQDRADGLQARASDASARWDSARSALNTSRARADGERTRRAAAAPGPFMKPSRQAPGGLPSVLALIVQAARPAPAATRFRSGFDACCFAAPGLGAGRYLPPVPPVC